MPALTFLLLNPLIRNQENVLDNLILLLLSPPLNVPTPRHLLPPLLNTARMLIVVATVMKYLIASPLAVAAKATTTRIGEAHGICIFLPPSA